MKKFIITENELIDIIETSSRIQAHTKVIESGNTHKSDGKNRFELISELSLKVEKITSNLPLYHNEAKTFKKALKKISEISVPPINETKKERLKRVRGIADKALTEAKRRKENKK